MIKVCKKWAYKNEAVKRKALLKAYRNNQEGSSVLVRNLDLE
jgi:hypothetical protein